jgi:hypothetical protein
VDNQSERLTRSQRSKLATASRRVAGASRRSGVADSTLLNVVAGGDPLLTSRRDILIGWRAWRNARAIHASSSRDGAAAQPAPRSATSDDRPGRSARYQRSYYDDKAKLEADRAAWEQRQKQKAKRQELAGRSPAWPSEDSSATSTVSYRVATQYRRMLRGVGEISRSTNYEDESTVGYTKARILVREQLG